LISIFSPRLLKFPPLLATGLAPGEEQLKIRNYKLKMTEFDFQIAQAQFLIQSEIFNF
jgi:hypothetical protein